ERIRDLARDELEHLLRVERRVDGLDRLGEQTEVPVPWLRHPTIVGLPAVTFSDWLIALHVLSAIIVIGSLTMLWTLIVATRPSAPLIAADSAKAFGRVGGPLVGVGMMGVVIFGIWLAIDDDGYHVWG